MSLNKKTVADVEIIFDYLLGVLSQVKQGNNQELTDGAFDYAKIVLSAAEEPMRVINMFDTTLRAFKEAERLVRKAHSHDALRLLTITSDELMEKSGTSEKLRSVLSMFKLAK